MLNKVGRDIPTNIPVTSGDLPSLASQSAGITG